MRRHIMLAAFLSAPIGLAAAGCSSDESDALAPGPDASPDSTPGPKEDASVPDAPGPKPDAGPHEPGWDPSFSLPGVSGRLGPAVNAIARIANRQIALAGNFEQAGSIPTKFVALWNGNQWLSISTGLTGAIDKMVATPTGELFGTVRTDTGATLFKWNKTVWTEVAQFDGHVTGIDMAPDGTLYASGAFTTIGASAIADLAKFSNNTWSAVPNAPEGAEVVRVVGTSICVGGRFNPWSGGLGVQCLENGTWQDKPFGPDANGNIADIGVQNGTLVAAGQFTLDMMSDAGSLARWSGSEWELIGGGLEGIGAANVVDMEIDGDKIYVTGGIRFAGGQQVSHAAMWDVTAQRWSSLNDGIFGSSGGVGLLGAPPGRVLALDQGGELYVGGQFSLIGGRNALAIARWDGNQWNPVDDPKAKRLGVNGGVSAFAETSSGALYVGGSFVFTGGDVAASSVARIENDVWSALGAGFDGEVSALAAGAGVVYAGGDFMRSGVVLTKNVAAWNGSTWTGIGSGLDGSVAALAVGPDGNLYAGGDFTEAGSVVVNHVAKWNGTRWSALGAGFDGAVRSLFFDASGKLYAGGDFAKSGNTDVKHIAAWSGTSWSQVGPGLDADYGASVSAIVTYDGKLTIGGSFDKSGTTTIGHVASFDGTAWRAVGGGIAQGGVAGLAVRGKELLVAGRFQAAGADDGGAATAFGHVASWNGASWSNLGGGLADTANAILATKDAFWVGGTFTFAGDYGSHHIARFWFTP
ncbi:MAG: hypothetical protein KF795_18250 [Labilithrix sp.]|nr:hypothetical protein [Labilithrix sp.]